MNRILSATLILILAGCATIDPNIEYYNPPARVTANTGGSIVGSRVPQTWPVDHQTTYVLGVSGQPVRGGKSAYAVPVILDVGAPRITIAWTQGSLFGQATVELTVSPGDQFVIKHEKIEKDIVRVWLEVVGKNTLIGDAFFVRISAPSSGTITPIFIPRAR
jgi:hypothetical protein